MTEQESKVQGVLLATVVFALKSGLTYVEGMAMFRAATFLMEEINRNPQIDEDFLATKAAEFIKAELAAVQ